MNSFNQIMFEAIKLALAGIIGGLIGARANDKLTRRRERDTGRERRKLDFHAFLACRRSEIKTPPHNKGIVYVDVPDVANKLKAPNTADEKFEDVVKSAQQAAVLVLICWIKKAGNKDPIFYD
jgi:hypothetical protein